MDSKKNMRLKLEESNVIIVIAEQSMTSTRLRQDIISPKMQKRPTVKSGALLCFQTVSADGFGVLGGNT